MLCTSLFYIFLSVTLSSSENPAVATCLTEGSGHSACHGSVGHGRSLMQQKSAASPPSNSMAEDSSSHLLREAISYANKEDTKPLHSPPRLQDLLVAPPSTVEPYNFSKYTVGTHTSQMGQSNWVDDVLKQRPNLFVVESGAWDGEEFSNSLFFETGRQSKCLLIEPNPAAQETILRKRRKCHLMRGALSTEPSYPSTHELIMAGGVGGFVESIEDNKKDLVKGAIAYGKEGGHAEFSGKKVNVTCFPLHAIMAELGVPTVDYWSLDAEGAEPAIVENTDFSKIEVGVMTIERVPQTRQRIYEAMTKNGFVRVAPLGEDDAYANPKYFSKRGIAFPKNACRDNCV